MRSFFGHRFFFALAPPPRLARLMANAAPWFDEAGHALRPDRLHVTLFLLPDFADYIPGVVKALHGMGGGLDAAPVEMMLDHAVGGASSIALRPSRRIPALVRLRHQLLERARSAGVGQRPDYRFAPHLTLGYRAGAPFQQRITPVAWRAEEVVLIHSLLGRTRHEVLGRWRLTGTVERQLALL